VRGIALGVFNLHNIDLCRARKLCKFLLVRVVLPAQVYLQQHGPAASLWPFKKH
jgi:hypothetical protein